MKINEGKKGIVGIVVILIIVAVVFIFLFKIIRPLEGMTMKNNPLNENLCELQTSCHAHFEVNESVNESDDTVHVLAQGEMSEALINAKNNAETFVCSCGPLINIYT